jgi:pimeloyl-ACP methyl ester carboxylesterase
MKTLTVSGIVPRNHPGGVTMTDATSATSATPTAVFVHGAWADASGFGGVIRALGDRGFAAIGNEQVRALVFLNGWMPDEGESIQQLFESEVFAGSLVPAAIRQVPFTNPDGSEGVDLYLDRGAFPEAFAADVDPETAKVMAATQRPWSGAGYATSSGPPGWRSIPSWYLLGTEDRAIPPAGQRFMAERGNAQIEEVAASHASWCRSRRP